MFEGKHIQIGIERYIQRHGTLERAGGEMVSFGKKAYLLYEGDVVKGKLSRVLKKSPRKSGITLQSEIFEGPPTEKNFGEVAVRARRPGAEIVTGIGGGHVIDIARAAGGMIGASTFTIPTSAATCAAYTILYAVYGGDGDANHSGFLSHEIGRIIIDVDLVADDYPRHHFMSGIVDAIAKEPEFSLTMAHLKGESMITVSEITTKITDFTCSKYMEDTKRALKDFDNGKNSMLIDSMVNVDVVPTGMVSSLSTGSEQLAVIHNFYDATCCMYRDVGRKYLHGEVVAMTLSLQLAINRSPKAEVEELRAFLREVGIPVSVREAGVPQDGLKELIAHAHRVTIPDGVGLLE